MGVDKILPLRATGGEKPFPPGPPLVCKPSKQEGHTLKAKKQPVTSTRHQVVKKTIQGALGMTLGCSAQAMIDRVVPNRGTVK